MPPYKLCKTTGRALAQRSGSQRETSSGVKGKAELYFALIAVLMHAGLPATAGQPATKSIRGWPKSIFWAGAATSAGLAAASTAWPAADSQQSSDKLVQALIWVFDVLQGRLTSHIAA